MNWLHCRQPSYWTSLGDHRRNFRLRSEPLVLRRPNLRSVERVWWRALESEYLQIELLKLFFCRSIEVFTHIRIGDRCSAISRIGSTSSSSMFGVVVHKHIFRHGQKRWINADTCRENDLKRPLNDCLPLARRLDLTWKRRISRGLPAFFKQFWLHLRKNLRKNLKAKQKSRW